MDLNFLSEQNVEHHMKKATRVPTSVNRINNAIVAMYRAFLVAIVRANPDHLSKLKLPVLPVLDDSCDSDSDGKTNAKEKKIKPITKVMQELNDSIDDTEMVETKNLKFGTCVSLKEYQSKIGKCESEVRYSIYKGLLTYAIYGEALVNIKKLLRKKGLSDKNAPKFQNYVTDTLKLALSTARGYMCFYHIYMLKNNVIHSKKPFRFFNTYGTRIKRYLEAK